MNTKANDALSEHDEGEDQNTEYVAVEEHAEDEAHAVEAHHEEDDSEDARLDEDNEDREGLRRRRREEKAERAQRRKEAIARDKAELEALRRQNADLNHRMSAIEKRSTMSQAHALQQRIRETEEEIRAAEYVMAQATNAGNGDDVVRAMKIRDEAMLKARELTAAQMRMQQANQPRQQQQPQQQGMLDVMGHKLATDWAQMNDWFDPQGGDELSREAIKIDQKLINDGYNPNSLKYWQKLTELTNDLTSNRRTGSRGGPQMGSGRERSQGSSRSEVYISPERKAAMIETGAWEDPERRKRMLRQYAEWDRNNSK